MASLGQLKHRFFDFGQMSYSSDIGYFRLIRDTACSRITFRRENYMWAYPDGTLVVDMTIDGIFRRAHRKSWRFVWDKIWRSYTRTESTTGTLYYHKRIPIVPGLYPAEQRELPTTTFSEFLRAQPQETQHA